MSKISASFLAENRLGRQVPKKWLDYVSASADKNLWKHYYLWEAYQVLELLEGAQIDQLKVLEPGCGDGVVGCLLSLMGAEVTLLDYDRTALAHSRDCARRLGVDSRVRFVQADLFSMPLPPHTFDLVWNDGVVEHFADPVKVVRAMSEMAKPGGRVLVTTPSKWTLHTALIRPWKRWKGNYPFDKWGREQSFSAGQLRGLLQSAGLSGVQSSTHHLRRAVLDDSSVLYLIANRLVRPVAPRLFNMADTLEVRHRSLAKLGFMVAAVGQV